VSLRYGEEYTIPPWQVVRQNPPTVPSSVQLGSNSERRWRFAYTFTADPQRGAPNGLLLGFREPERNWWRFGYTSLSHPHPYQLTQITDPTERFSRITAWDAFGRPTRSEVYPYQGEFGWDENRPVWQEIEYDPVGRVREVRWGYDERGRRYQNPKRYQNGSVRYNWLGHLLVGFTDARGRQVQFGYDPFQRGLLSSITINGALYASLGYDWWGRLTRVEGGNGVGLRYEYTYRDALRCIFHDGDLRPEGTPAFEEFRHSDCCGQINYWKRQDGQELFFDHTRNGWLERVRYRGVGGSLQTLYTYGYDTAGRLTLAQSADSTVRYTYDTDITDTDRTGWLERTETTLAGRAYVFNYGYYLNGDLRGFEWKPAGAWLPFSTLQFTYDGAGRLATQSYSLRGIGSQLGLTVTHAYDGAGRLAQQQVQVQVGAQQRTLTTSLQYADYQSIGSVWTQSVLLDGRTVANYAYSYYEDGTLRTASEQHTEPNGSSTQRQLGWDYYPDGSLQYERLGTQQPRTFDYDSGGNMTLGVPAAPNLTAQYQFNQLRQLGSWSFAYNLNGERVGEQNAPDGNREYGYDGFGNLVWVRRNGQLVYEARYDALGRRVAYRTSNRDWDWIYLLYDGDMLVAELDAYGQVRAEYVWGSLGPVARIAGGRVQLYVCDALGHVRALIDAETGQITDRYDYDAWGNVVHNGTTRQPFTWNGAYGYEWMPFAWDRASGYGDGWRSEVGLYHVGARAYDPRTARWLQRDPIDAASGDPNLYRYCGNDPVNYRDPTGTEIQDELSSVTCTRGKMEIVRMALEEARASGTSIRETQWWGYKLKTFIEHHIFPQADRLRRLFEKIGIDVDDCVMKVPNWFSDWIHSGKGKGGWWNRKWDEFMERAERWLKQKGESWDNMSECSKKFLKEQAHVWALEMLELVGVTDFDWSECMRYTRAKKKRR
jgi:RHS repeat-associated protein